MAAITPDVLYKAWKSVIIAIGGGIGWFVAEFSPTFPLIVVAVVFILYDAYTAYELDKRVHKMYPEKKKREKAHFTSFAFGKVLRETIPKRLWLIFLAYLVEHWVFIHVSIPLSYIITGAICFLVNPGERVIVPRKEREPLLEDAAKDYDRQDRKALRCNLGRTERRRDGDRRAD